MAIRRPIIVQKRGRKTPANQLIVHGTAAEVANAKEIIETTHPAELGMHAGEAVKSAA
ncbi:MAG: hypothetical protein WBW69_06470 [Candidatus Korobacteraceae bacterium]